MKTIKKIMFGMVLSAFMVINVYAQPKSEIIDDNDTKINWAEADTLYTFQFDSESNSWVFFQREIRRFNEENIPTENFVQNWNIKKKAWYNYLKVNYTYDKYGNEIEEITQKWDIKFNNWVNANLKTITYNGRNREEILFQEWKKPTDEWYNVMKYLIKYNEKGEENSISISLFNGITQNWDNHKKFIMEFSSPFSPPTRVTSESWINANWEEEGLYEIQYNARGHKTMEIRYTWNQGLRKWIEGSKIEMAYDKKGNQLDYLEFKFDFQKSEWTKHSKNEAIYNESGYMTEKIEYVWNRNTNQWDVAGKFRFTTDAKI
jgi:hypothetical protein